MRADAMRRVMKGKVKGKQKLIFIYQVQGYDETSI